MELMDHAIKNEITTFKLEISKFKLKISSSKSINLFGYFLLCGASTLS